MEFPKRFVRLAFALVLLLGPLGGSLSRSVSAGTVVDTDADFVPDQFDNCRIVANGPNQVSNQVDSDFAIFLGKFSVSPGAPGPSGLSCAHCTLGADPCTP